MWQKILMGGLALAIVIVIGYGLLDAASLPKAPESVDLAVTDVPTRTPEATVEPTIPPVTVQDTTSTDPTSTAETITEPAPVVQAQTTMGDTWQAQDVPPTLTLALILAGGCAGGLSPDSDRQPAGYYPAFHARIRPHTDSAGGPDAGVYPVDCAAAAVQRCHHCASFRRAAAPPTTCRRWSSIMPTAASHRGRRMAALSSMKPESKRTGNCFWLMRPAWTRCKPVTHRCA